MMADALAFDLSSAKEKPFNEALVGPYNEKIAICALPPRHTHWTARRKAEIVTIVRAGLLNLEDIFARYKISGAEYQAWCAALDKAGLPALHATKRPKKKIGAR